ncbi:MAG: MCE family protein [Ignavibacteriales bacterium]|nr:MCE family protein [Ignavibacteriales bacterium]
MKSESSNKIKLGAFITLGLAVLIAGVYFIGEKQQLFRSTFRISGVFKDVAGLQAGNNVRFSGINVGTVENISIISDSAVNVVVIVDEATRKYIRKDAIASIGSEGLMGNKILIINPGLGLKKGIEDNDRIATEQPIDMDDVLLSLKTTIDNASILSSDLAKITKSIEAGKGTIGKLIMDETLARNFDSAIVSLKVGSNGMRLLMADAQGSFARNFDSTFINLKEASAGFKILMDKAKSSWMLWGF